MGKVIPTPEQAAIYQIKCGFFIVTANAGSGKTSSCEELFLTLYLREQKRLFPGRGHVQGKDQLYLLSLFWLLTYTRKAAQELDERIHQRLKAEGIPVPERFGRPVRICRTLDSVLRDWIRSPAFFNEWKKFHPALPSIFNRFALSLPASVQQELAKPEIEPALSFFWRWQSTLTEIKQLILIDAIICETSGEIPIGGASLDELVSGVLAHLKNITSVADLQEYPPILTKCEEEYIRQRTHYAHIELQGGRSLTATVAQELHYWHVRTDRLHSFLTAFDYARSRGWAPGNPLNGIDRRDILVAIANTDGALSIQDFLTFSSGYQKAKCAMGMMDFGDNLEIFVSIINKAAHLLERSKEYPTRGIRRKYVIQDENQDYNRAQFQVQKALCAAEGVEYISLGVGDPFQSLYEFRGADPMLYIRWIERLRETRPENLLTLSCCFRSGRKIVALGNEILQTLSRHGDVSTPSRAAKDFDGEIHLPLPFTDNVTEANYILEKAAPLAAAGATVMVLLRSNPHAHPVSKLVANSGLKNISVLTVHSSKGLEADHVFIAGFNAGVFPDVRCSYEQEKNGFYVATTRGRYSLTITCHLTTITVEKDGSVAETAAEPSPFLKLVPSLAKLAIDTGWQGALLSSGVSAHKQAIAVQIEKRETRLSELREELKLILQSAGVNLSTEVGSAQSTAEVIYRGARPSSFEIELSPEDPAPSQIEKCKDVFGSCKRVFLKGGRPSHLNVEERTAALKNGWLAYRGDGNQVFSPVFVSLLQARS